MSRASLTSAALLVPLICVLAGCRYCRADDSEISQQLGLADLAGYRAALSGKATADLARADEPPARVAFRDLWDREEQFRGRRVTIEGRVVRIFRQGPVGSFPSLAEVWITSPAGDPFCAVFAQPAPPGEDDANRTAPAHTEGKPGKAASAASMPALGSTVRFTGTFLKKVRYAAGDGARLAPLVVGDRLPVAVPPSEASARIDQQAARTAIPGPADQSAHTGAGLRLGSPSALGWLVGATLLALAASALLRRFLSFKPQRAGRPNAGRHGARLAPQVPDLPLEFIEPPRDPEHQP